MLSDFDILCGTKFHVTIQYCMWFRVMVVKEWITDYDLLLTHWPLWNFNEILDM